MIHLSSIPKMSLSQVHGEHLHDRKALALTVMMLCCLGALLAAAAPAADYPIQPVPFTAVHLKDNFWAPRLETNRLVTIPYAFEQCEKSGRMDNFTRAARTLAGET